MNKVCLLIKLCFVKYMEMLWKCASRITVWYIRVSNGFIFCHENNTIHIPGWHESLFGVERTSRSKWNRIQSSQKVNVWTLEVNRTHFWSLSMRSLVSHTRKEPEKNVNKAGRMLWLRKIVQKAGNIFLTTHPANRTPSLFYNSASHPNTMHLRKSNKTKPPKVETCASKI